MSFAAISLGPEQVVVVFDKKTSLDWFSCSIARGAHDVNLHQILITGGAGFLASHLVDRFRCHGARVRLFDIAARPDWAQGPGIEYVRGDVRDEKLTRAALEGVDTVLHAAFASPRQNLELVRSVNTEGTRILCRCAGARGVARLVLISSTIVARPPKVHPFLSNSPLTRLDAYRSTRAEAEKIASDCGNTGMQVAIVRPKTFIGPGYLSAFAIVFEWIRLGRPVLILGDGENRYQLVDVRDMADGLALLARSDAAGVFYFGGQEFGTVRHDLQALLHHARTGSRLCTVPRMMARAALRGIELANIVPLSEWHYMNAHGKDSVVDISRTAQELGWRPKWSNAQSLLDAYDWYVGSMRATGTVRTKFPVPVTHRALKYLSWFLPH